MARAIRLVPGVLLMFVIGYAGKFTEQSIAAYGRAHHVALPNIEYVLWAIAFGLIVANTVGVPHRCEAGVDTYEFWLKVGIVLLGVRFLLGDIARLGGVSLLCVIVEPSPIERTNDPSGMNSSSGWLPRFKRKIRPFELSATPTASDGQMLSGSLKKSSSTWNRSCGADAVDARPPAFPDCPTSGAEAAATSASAAATISFMMHTPANEPASVPAGCAAVYTA